MRRVTGLPDDQVTAWEAKLEQQVVDSLQAVMDKIAARIERIQVASAAPRILVAVATTGPTGDDDPPPMTGELAIPDPTPYPAAIPATPDLPPGQPYISPDDLASIPPLWQQQVADQVLPLVAQVFLDSAGHVRSQILDAVAPNVLLSVPDLGSVAAEQYLAQAKNTFEQVGDHLWATARAQLSEGFDAGESIPQLGARLRQSAGLSARTAVMVARTQVIEASNYGSITMARTSGLQMEKEWIATPDLRTRPTHLAADGQRVALSEPFIVGGYAADFPAAPNLPPAERYGCRCTQGYVMPDRQPALPSKQLDELPGTSRPAIEPRPEPDEGPLTLFYPKAGVPGDAGDDLGDLVAAPTKVRPELLRATSPAELTTAWQAQMRAITGRDIIVQLPPDASVLTMREQAEGVLQMLERFPEARLRKISWFDGADSANYAQVRRGAATIEFNARFSSVEGRRAYLASLRSDVKGWDATPGPGIGWSVRGARLPQATSYHEFAHILSIETLAGARLESRALSVLNRRAALEGIDADTLAARDISAYAGTDGEELIGEAMADVMVNGSRASAVSREIYDLVVTEYRARGLAVRTSVSDLTDELGAEDFGVDLFPKAAAPRALSSQTVAQLRALAKERGITVPAGTRKADLVRMLDETPSVPAGVAPVSAAVPARVLVARAELERVVASPVVREPYSVGGSSAKNVRVGHESGDVIIKDYTRDTKAAGVRDADAEELGALVMDALDVPTQTVLRTGERQVTVSVLEGDFPADIGMGLPGPARQALADTDGGRLLGLGDVLIGNSDRRRNFVRLADGRPASFDLGGAFRAPKLAAAADPEGTFAHHFATKTRKAWAPNDMAPADLALIRQRLEALKPEFDRLGRATWHNQMMARLVEVEKRATGTRTRLAEATGDVVGPEVRAVARQATIDERRAVADSLAEARELLANGASERALARRAGLIEGRASGAAGDDLAGLVRAMRSGDADQIRVAIGDVSQRRGLTAIDAPAGQDWVPYDPKLHDLATGEARPPAGTFVHVSRPGYSVRLDDGEVVQLAKAKVERLTPDELAAVRGQAAEQSAAAERKAVREAARERNRVIEAQRGTARLLAEVDELAAKGATKTVIRERLDPALREAGQAYAGADSAAVDAVSAALDSGDLAKVRAAVTRASAKAKIKPIGRAGAKTTFDPDTMEGVGGIDIAPGAKVTVVRRGSTVPGLTDPLAKAQVTPIAAPVKAAPKVRAKPFEVPSVEIMAERSGVSRDEVAEIRRLTRSLDRPPAIMLRATDIPNARLARTHADSERVKAFAQAHLDIFNRIVQEQSITRDWAEVVAPAFARQGKAMAQVRAESVDKLREAVKDQPIIIRRATESRLRQALDDGRLKTQFETGTSSGILDTEMRANFEGMDFGYGADFPADQRPVYGYIGVGGVRGASDFDGAVSGYGNIQLVLRDSVRPRVTVTAGDSLDLRAFRRPSPIDRIDWRSTGGPDRDYGERWLSSSYIEAQIHGGVTWDDVAEVVFVRTPEPETLAALERRGVAWRVLKPGQT